MPLELSEKLCDPPWFYAGDEFLERSGDGGLLGRLAAHAKGAIEQLLVEGETGDHV